MLPKGLPDWVAHTPNKNEPENWHLFTKHTREVAEWAREYASAFGAGEIAYYLGLVHDTGKLSTAFQQYLLDCYQWDNTQKGKKPEPGSAPHKHVGALLAILDAGKLGKLLAISLLGHHGGMKSAGETEPKTRGKTNETQARALQTLQMTDMPELTPVPPKEALAALAADPRLRESAFAELYTRMLFSCLVDADGLDTESHKNPDNSARRGVVSPSLEILSEILSKYMAWRMARAQNSQVNTVRREVYDACYTAAELPPGVFTLAVPTGGGKTLASLTFALEHAVKHKLRRVIFAIPFTSIVDQTVSVFQEVLGDDPGILLEHHSAIESRADESDSAQETEAWRRLAAENWDAPLIVTTTVQLFESLYANKPSRCRKLHRLTKSVIVLDEVQTLPPTLLTPILSALRLLTEHFGVTVLLCTATQPALEKQGKLLQGFPKVTPIIGDVLRDSHFSALRRVTYRVEQTPWSWEQVVREMRTSGNSCLCVVNTRRQALELLSLLDPNGKDSSVLHLSTLLCGRHRRTVLSEVRERLKSGPPVLLVSTQVIEAGVDVDFPKALRALGPLDRMIQTAGRCNREGLRDVHASEVVLFRPEEDKTPHGTYKTACDLTRQWLENGLIDAETLHEPARITAWFAELFGDIDLDKKNVMERVRYLDYPEVAQKMRLIDDDTVPVFIADYEPAAQEAARLLSEIRGRKMMTRDLWRRVQPFCVSLFRWDADPQKSAVEEIAPGLLLWRGSYDAKRGIDLLQDPADAIVYSTENLMV